MSTRSQTNPAWLIDRPIAHRGLHASDAPENSLSAFQSAIDAGFHIELDVRLLADSEVVVFHDASLKRMTGASHKVSDQTTPYITKLCLAGSSEHPALLRDVLNLVAGQVGLLIEIKNESATAGRLENAVIELLEPYSGQCAVQSFNPISLLYFKRHAPWILRGQLAGGFKEYMMPGVVRWYMRNGVLHWPTEPDFIGFELDDLPDRSVDARRSRGVPILAWTIRTPKEALRAKLLADNMIFEGFVPVH